MWSALAVVVASSCAAVSVQTYGRDAVARRLPAGMPVVAQIALRAAA